MSGHAYQPTKTCFAHNELPTVDLEYGRHEQIKPPISDATFAHTKIILELDFNFLEPKTTGSIGVCKRVKGMASRDYLLPTTMYNYQLNYWLVCHSPTYKAQSHFGASGSTWREALIKKIRLFTPGPTIEDTRNQLATENVYSYCFSTLSPL